MAENIKNTIRFGALPLIAWSLFCAAVLIGADLAHEYAGTPDLTAWALAMWPLGLALSVRSGSEKEQ